MQLPDSRAHSISFSCVDVSSRSQFFRPFGHYKNILSHLTSFLWPGLRSDVVRYCRSCHTCQIVGKPNQSISPAPLCPIPVVGEPFERVILDCVGPLPRTKSGHKFILTMMCSNTRFPEAVPLRTIKTKGVLQALTKFFSTFGLPKVVQTDQGTNFMSRYLNKCYHSSI